MYRNSWLPEVFNDFFYNSNMPKANATAPAINVLESADEYTVELAAPGLRSARERRRRPDHQNGKERGNERQVGPLSASRVFLQQVRANAHSARRRRQRKDWCSHVGWRTESFATQAATNRSEGCPPNNRWLNQQDALNRTIG